MLVAGIMSGTSLDGIDVAVVDVTGNRASTVAHSTTPYSAATRKRILAVSNTQCSTGEISRLNFELGESYSDAVLATCRRYKIPLRALMLAGCHGQTIYHEGSGNAPNTLQIGEASVIAERLGVPVVSDFRTRDIAAGGQGAPLVPFVDYLLFRSNAKHRVSLNIGGIANITVLPRNARPDEVIAFDTGPGNMVIDQLVEQLSGGRRHFDRSGAIASRGHIQRDFLDVLLNARYFSARPPKTAGREQYGQEFIARLLATQFPLEDLIATATAFTAATVALGVKRFASGAEELIAAGGGTHNRQLMAQIAAFLPRVRVATTAEFGIDPDAKEAVAFAILAWRTWRRKPGNLPSATGARHSVILGKLTLQ
jgi:anhydro-N-acetylmuramic acid kinase